MSHCENTPAIAQSNLIPQLTESLAALWGDIDRLDLAAPEDAGMGEQAIRNKLDALYWEKETTARLICHTQAQDLSQGLVQLMIASELTHELEAHFQCKKPEWFDDIKDLQQVINSVYGLIASNLPSITNAAQRVKDAYRPDRMYANTQIKSEALNHG